MTKALEWNRSPLGADKKKIEWLKKLKAEGKRVKLLDDEPVLNHYELCILSASNVVQNLQDVESWGRIHGIIDLEEFTELVLFTKMENQKNA